MIGGLLGFCIRERLLVLVAMLAVVVFGWSSMQSVPLDAIPNVGENQVIVLAEWPGRSPRDMEDQVTYPLSALLQAVPGARSVRGRSMFGFSFVQVTFEDAVDFYWARSRVSERLTTAGGLLPEGVRPALAPDATALGQIFHYVLEGPTGTDLAELRSKQDFFIRYALQSVDGVAEVASVGGYVKQYQVEADPAALRFHGVSLSRLVSAVGDSGVDVGARTVESGGMEFVVRGRGFVGSGLSEQQTVAQLEETVVLVRDGVPVRVRDVARVQTGPAYRDGALDYNGQEAVGGIVVMRYRENPRAVIQRVLAKIADLERDLGGIRIRPVYDRTQLIDETVQTLTQSIAQETIITIVITVLFLLHFRASLVIAVTLPLAVLLAWIGMRVFGVDANIMSLAGIAIAVGTMVDMAIIILENIYAGLSDWEQQGCPGGARRRLVVIRESAQEVAPAVMTAVGTTIISFLPVFFLTGRDYRLFAPLAWTKTYALVASLVVAVAVVPMLSRVLLRSSRMSLRASLLLSVLAGVVGAGVTLTGLLEVCRSSLGCSHPAFAVGSGLLSAVLMFLVSRERIRPIEQNPVSRLLRWLYGGRLRFALRYKLLVLSVPAVVLVLGAGAWFGLGRVLRPVEQIAALVGADLRSLPGYQRACEVLPGLESDDWIALDEGSWFYMPSLYPAASFSQAMEVLQAQNTLIREIPEVEHVLGKIGRAQSALDPAPASMIETYVMLKPRDQWRAGMTERGIWDAVNAVATLPGVTPASALQPIEGRVVMLQAGIKAAMAVRIYGDSLEGLSAAALSVADRLKRHPLVNAQTVAPDIVLGKPYLEFDADRAEAARYGMTTKMVNEIISAGLGGVDAAMTVEGRERYPVQVRFSRDVRESLSELPKVPVVTETGEVVPLQRLASVRTTWGPGMISSEDSRLVAHVMFSPAGLAGDLETVDAVMGDLSEARQSGELKFPDGNFEMQSVGSFQSQLEANQRLMWIIPLVAAINFLLIYLEFRDLPVTLAVFTGLPVSFAGGMLMVGLAGVQLNTAVWIGFIATLGLAEDDGVVMATFIRQLLGRRKIDSVQQLRATVLEAGMKRIRPCMMTTATTLIALIPVLTATGRGAEVARAMAWPVLGGMLVEPFASFVVPVMYCAFLELRLLAGFGVADSAECESLPIMPELPCGSVG